MTNIRVLLCSLTCFASVVSLAQNVHAEFNPTPQIFIINIQNAISSTEDGRKAFEVLEKKFDGKKNDLKSKGEELDALKRQYEAQGSKLNDDARATLSGQINSKQRGLGRLQDGFRLNLTKSNPK
jgi:Skp family chaperone for outer membrane proteins